MSELNREQIIKALTCCTSGNPCSLCEYRAKSKDTFGCRKQLLIDALAVILTDNISIRMLTKQNKRLQAEITHLEGHRESDIKAFKTLKADTVRKMQERLKEKMNNLSRMEYNFKSYFLVRKSFIDQIARELLEEEK